MVPVSMKVLLVEDNVMLSETYAEILSLLGHEVLDIVVTGPDAIEAARRNLPDLVLMDIALEGVMSGIEAAEIIVEHRPMPIIFISGFSDEKVRARVSKIPNHRFMMKPIDFEALREVISGLVKAGSG